MLRFMNSYRLSLLLIVLLMLLTSVTVTAQDAGDGPAPLGIRPDAPTYALHGPHWVGTMTYEGETAFHPTKVLLWYPALNPDGLDEEHTYMHDYYPDTLLPVFGHALAEAAPNIEDGPYPLVILATGHEGPRMFMAYLGEHLASLGFVVLSADFEDNQGTAGQVPMIRSLYTRPADLKWQLDQAEALTVAGGMLEGMIDNENIAVVGYSFGGYTALAAAGARLDFDAFRSLIADNPELCNNINCETVLPYEQELAELAGLDAPPEGLWPSWADQRVDAVVTFASGWGDYMSAESVADIDIPVMMFAGTADRITSISTRPVYENLTTSDKRLILFDDATHMAWFWTCDEAPWLNNPNAYFFCIEPVWDKERTHDLANHFVGAFLLDVLVGDEYAHAALAPENVQFPGTNYEATGY